jgi:hypothetical protein
MCFLNAGDEIPCTSIRCITSVDQWKKIIFTIKDREVEAKGNLYEPH